MPGVNSASSSKGLQEPADLPHTLTPQRRDQRWCSVRPAQELRACLCLELLSCLPAQPQHLLLCVASFPEAEERTHAQRACLTSVTEFCTQCCSKLSPQPSSILAPTSQVGTHPNDMEGPCITSNACPSASVPSTQAVETLTRPPHANIQHPMPPDHLGRTESQACSHLVVSKILAPSGLAMRPRKLRPPEAFLCARPAIGVRQEPSRAVRKARSHSTASLVSSWFSSARRFSAALSPSLHAIPMAPCTSAYPPSAFSPVVQPVPPQTELHLASQ